MKSKSYSHLPAFEELLKRVSLSAGRVVGFVGAGLSRPAKLPSWPELRDLVLKDYRAEAQTFDPQTKEQILKKCSGAESIDDLWISFSVLKKIRPAMVFEASIRRHLNSAAAEPPENYQRLWKAGLNGIITLNLDDFAQRSFSAVSPGAPLELFTGTRIRDFVDVFTRDARFLCNLHGQLGEASSWVFTEEERTKLRSGDGLKEFFSACFLTSTVVFVGVSAEDVGAGGLLLDLLEATKATRAGSHYWISDRLDADACAFADKVGLHRISYSPDDNHFELACILDDLRTKKYEPPTPGVVTPPGKKLRNFEKPSAAELFEIKDSNELRRKLNEIALSILGTSSVTKLKDYEKFLEDYEEVIARSWFIPKSAKAPFFDYQLERLISGDGAFGKVYEAKDSSGKSCAIKVIHNSVHDDTEMLEAFRRGVASMKIVSGRGIEGVVAIKDAWEMPASIVMEFIDGLNLEQAVEDHAVTDWGIRLNIFEQLAKVLLKAHRLPEVVVHRDVRPPNVILSGFYSSDDEVKVSLVDFDLSWHRDAFGKSIQQTVGIHGYFAPEQYNKISGASSRNALVDSYGLAMTVFFVITGRHPQFSEANGNDWVHEIHRSFRLVPSNTWNCIPTRLARLVARCTKYKQPERLDMTAMLREFSSLKDLYEKDLIPDIRLLVDEIGHRSKRLNGNYSWDETEGRLIYDSPTGLSITVSRRNTDELHVSAEWKNSGDAKYQSVKRYFETTSQKLGSTLKSSGWSCEIDSKFDGMRMSAMQKINLKKMKSKDIDNRAEDLDRIMAALSYSGQ